jgi:hypothetical protein
MWGKAREWVEAISSGFSVAFGRRRHEVDVDSRDGRFKTE